MMRSSAKTLSVIVPNYNKGPFIRECLQSIILQTRQPDELIVVDDHSSDESVSIIKEFAANFPTIIKAVYLSENHGVQYARNYGVTIARSEYITCLDSDDIYVDSRKLERELALARPKRIVSSKYCILHASSNVREDLAFSRIRYWFFELFAIPLMVRFDYMQYWPYAYIISRDAFMKVGGYDFPVPYYEDLDILIKLRLLGLNRKMVWSVGKGYRVGYGSENSLSAQRHLFGIAKDTIRKRYGGEGKFETSVYQFLKTIRDLFRKNGSR